MSKEIKRQVKKAMYHYEDYYRKCGVTLTDIIHYYSKEQGYKMAMWGGGLKGIAFLNIFDSNNEYINYVFDIDKSKYNTQLPTGHTIVDYKAKEYSDIDVIFIMNNNFETEIAGMLKEVGSKALLVNIESIVCGNLSKGEAMELYNVNHDSSSVGNGLEIEEVPSISTAAIVFLYNYDEKCIENIKSYANQVDIVYAFDNTEQNKKNQQYQESLGKIKNLEYIDGQGNQGLSYAINHVAKICLDKGIDWLITFDQDSKVQKDMLQVMKKFIITYKYTNKIGIICPTIKNLKLKYAQPVYEYSYHYRIIQSGALHNLKAYLAIDGYDENLFIDQVDYDYCVRLRANEYQIVKLNSAILEHNVADNEVELKYIHGRKIYVNKFSPMRYYYIFRNSMYCIKKHQDTDRVFCADLKRDKKILFQTLRYDDNKLKKIKAIILAIIDYYTENMGKSRRKIYLI